LPFSGVGLCVDPARWTRHVHRPLTPNPISLEGRGEQDKTEKLGCANSRRGYNSFPLLPSRERAGGEGAACKRPLLAIRSNCMAS
jgi:hypothetical protein